MTVSAIILSVTVKTEISLRDRKRLETWASLHAAAARLTLEYGPERVTVEEIARQANVSPRTFFNYFSTKEDAILGLQEPAIDERWLENLDAEHGLLGQVSRLLLAVGHSTQGGDESASQRAEVLRKFPQLRQRRFAYFVKVEQLVRTVVAERIANSHRWQAVVESSNAEDAARMIILVAGAPMRYAMQEAADAPTIENQYLALDRATILLREVLREIQ